MGKVDFDKLAERNGPPRVEDAEPMEVPSGDAGSYLVPAHVLAGEGIALAERRNTKKEKPVPVPLGSYGEIIGGTAYKGYWPGAHVLVAGTGAGKTAFACQVAVEAARAGVPTAYIGLELDRPQVGLRFASIAAEKRLWSGAYTGRASQEDRDKLAQARNVMRDWPLFASFGEPGGWPADRLPELAANLAQHREDDSTPLLLVLDFLQLVGAPEDADGRRMDLRERIGRAAYQARQVARDYRAAVLVISSMARDKYGHVRDVAFGIKTSGPGALSIKGDRKLILNPDELVGLGKESGEIEYAADTVTVLIRGDDIHPEERKKVFDGTLSWYVCAVPKLRTGRPSWCALGFTGGGFVDLDYEARALFDGLQAKQKQKQNTKGRKNAPRKRGGEETPEEAAARAVAAVWPREES